MAVGLALALLATGGPGIVAFFTAYGGSLVGLLNAQSEFRAVSRILRRTALGEAAPIGWRAFQDLIRETVLGLALSLGFFAAPLLVAIVIHRL